MFYGIVLDIRCMVVEKWVYGKDKGRMIKFKLFLLRTQTRNVQFSPRILYLKYNRSLISDLALRSLTLFRYRRLSLSMPRREKDEHTQRIIHHAIIILERIMQNAATRMQLLRGLKFPTQKEIETAFQLAFPRFTPISS